MTPLELIGPLTPIGTSYYDKTQVERGLFHGRNFPAVPPPQPMSPPEPQRGSFASDEEHQAAYAAWLREPVIKAWIDAVDAYTRTHYYDLGWSLYIAHVRTGNPEFLSLARKVSDSWWKLPGWIDEGRVRQFDVQGTAPRNVGISGLILRALDSRPEMWDWINSYTRYHFDLWVTKRVNDPTLYYGLRDGSFSLQFAAQLAVALPDSFSLQVGGTATNGAELRAKYLADCENAVLNYFGRLQLPDGSWRWDDHDYIDSDGGHLVGVMQPFMVGLTLDALSSVYNVTQREDVKASIIKQVTSACRHLYLDGPYSKQFIPIKGVNLRGFHYFYHGGTSVNPTKYVKGDLPADFATWNPAWDVQNQRQPIGLIVAAYRWSYRRTGDPFFKEAGDELWDSAYGDTDGVHNYFEGDGKSYNQNVRSAPKYLALTGTPALPAPPPPTEPKPVPTSSPDGTKAATITDSIGGVWTIGPQNQTLRNGTHIGGGFGTLYKWFNSTVYVWGLVESSGTRNWWQWTGVKWTKVGDEPGVAALPKRVVETASADNIVLLARIAEMEALGYEWKSIGTRLVFQLR